MNDPGPPVALAGTVNRRGEALVELKVAGPAGQEALTCLIDTGFTGTLVIPEAVAQRLRLPRRGSTVATLADGSEALFRRYEAVIDWPSGRRRVWALATASADALVGVGLLRRHRLLIDYPARMVKVS